MDVNTRPPVIPADTPAERAVVAVVLLTRFGMPNVAGIVTEADFYDRTLASIFEAAGQLPDIGPFRDGPPVSWRPSSKRVRLAAASVIADVPLVMLEELAQEAPTMTDARPWARQVGEAARKRRAMARLARAYNRLGQGAELDEALSLLEEVAA